MEAGREAVRRRACTMGGVKYADTTEKSREIGEPRVLLCCHVLCCWSWMSHHDFAMGDVPRAGIPRFGVVGLEN